ncbi:hypothetical protein AWB80_08173 [Caballeronia pedi]|uniref:Uncharacterized protein n=1 Tax=Caballeronia pedi TaxID=1777141 RepID=A0A158E479_9BURK|nr:hypothetical protein [Caballeronia pedi]SAL01638.1 hypothetical protein AWB80_08173 [Caballeronia pedi]
MSTLPCHKHHLTERDQAFYIDEATIQSTHPALGPFGEPNHSSYNVAMILVGERHAKSDLVSLVGHLMTRIRLLDLELDATKHAALTGMDAAKRVSTIQLAEAHRARAESSPEVLASERAANAVLTDENEKLRENAERYLFLRDDCDWHQCDWYWEAISAGGEDLDKAIDEGRKNRAEQFTEASPF